MPEHDLTLRLVSGEHTSADAIKFFQSLDSTCATSWLSYFDPTVSMSHIDVASMPEMRHVIAQKRKELFGDKPKPYAIVCGSESSEQYFIQFWQKYYPESEAVAEYMRGFRDLEDAYEWLKLSDAARAAVAKVIRDWEMARAIDAWEVADGYSEGLEEATTSGGPGQAEFGAAAAASASSRLAAAASVT